MQDSFYEKKTESPSRLWWYPTGLFAFLPVHAAGIYDVGPKDTECVSDYVVSSYTPTLKALLTLPPPLPIKNCFKMMVAIQPERMDYLPLPGTIDELRNIEAQVPPEYLLKLGTEAAPASVEAVYSHLPTAHIAHFACHGEQNVENPLESALILADGKLKVSRIMAQSMPKASLVFLSACQTAMGDKNLPDEAMHLAATLMFGGFRGAVATMWSVYLRFLARRASVLRLLGRLWIKMDQILPAHFTNIFFTETNNQLQISLLWAMLTPLRRLEPSTWQSPSYGARTPPLNAGYPLFTLDSDQIIFLIIG